MQLVIALLTFKADVNAAGFILIIAFAYKYTVSSLKLGGSLCICF